jgi:hypothetical protein
MRCTWIVLVAVGVTANAPPALAQGEAPFARLALLGGQLRYRLPETRNGALLALRLAASLAPLGTRHWLLEPSVSYGSFRATPGQRRHVVVSEVELQAQSGTALFEPYVGIGGGLGLTRVDSTTLVRLTLSASAGVRWDVLESMGVLGEVRLRRLGLFQGWTRELTAGLYASFR